MSGEYDPQKLGELIQQVRHLESQVDRMDRRLTEVVEMAHRWRGAFALVLGMGSLIGWLLSVLPKWRG